MQSMRYVFVRIVLAALITASLSAAPASAQTSPFQDIPIIGNFGSGGTFTGSMNITQFIAGGVVISAVGTLTGTLTDALGNVVGTVTDLPVGIPLTGAPASCQMLFLELGPLDLDVLGLQLRLHRIVLNINDQQVPGNVLCAIAGALDTGCSRAIAQLLNRLLGNIAWRA